MEKFNITKTASTPMRPSLKLWLKEDTEPSDTTKFRSMLNTIGYCRRTRPDLLFVLKELSQVQSRPDKGAWETMYRMYAYLRKYPDYGILFKKTKGKLEIKMYSDSDSNGCPKTKRSTGGELVYFNGNAILADCANQSLITDSSAYAETYQVNHCFKLYYAFRTLLQELGIEVEMSPIYTDNSAAKSISFKTGLTKLTRHFDIKTLFYRQYVGSIVELKKVSTTENPADIMTKSLDVKTYQKHMQNIMVKETDLTYDVTKCVSDMFKMMMMRNSLQIIRFIENNCKDSIGK